MIELFGQDFCRKADRLFCRDGAVCPYFQSQLVIVGDLLNTSVVNSIVYLQYWGIDTVDVDLVQRHLIDLGLVLDGFVAALVAGDLFVLFRRNITLTFVQHDLHAQACIWSQCCNMHTWVQNFDVGITLDRTSGNLAFAFRIDVNDLWSVTIKLCS